MITSLIILFSLLPLITLSFFGYLFYKKERPLESIIFFVTLIHESILVSLPCIYAAFFDYKFEKELRFIVEPFDLLKVLLIENLYIFCFTIPFIIFLKLYKRPTISLIKSNPNLYLFFALISVIGIIVYTYQIINRPTIEEIVDSYSQSGLDSSNKFISFFTITFEHASIIIAAMLSVRGKQEVYPKLYQYLGIIMLLLVVLSVVVSGVRGRIIWVAEFAIIISILKGNFKPILLSLILLSALIPLNNILITQIRPISEEIAKEGGLTNKALLNIGTTIIKGVNDKNKIEGPGIFESLTERAQGPRNSMVLINEYDNGKRPGLNIYKGALLFFVPRLLINRPVIGSPSGEYKDAAIFKVMELNYNYSAISMGPLLASVHAYWEGGYLGVVVIALLSSILWILIFAFSYKQYLHFGILICLLVSCALLIDGFISAFTPLYALISIFWKSIVPLFLFYFFFLSVNYLKNNLLKRN